MKQKETYLNIPILIIGSLYLIITNIPLFILFFSEVLALFIIYILLIFFLIIGLVIFIRHTRKNRNSRFLMQAFYWFLVSSLILTNIIVILSPVFLKNDEGWVFFLYFTAIIIGLPSLVFISAINPRNNLDTKNYEQKSKKKSILKFLIPTVMILLISSTIVFFALSYVRIYGSDEGISYLLLLLVLNFNTVSFIPTCGIIQLQRKEPSSEKYKFSISKNKVPFFLAIFSMIGLLFSSGSIFWLYVTEVSKKFITANIIFYYVFIIGTLTILTLLFLVKKQITNLKEYDFSDPNLNE